MSYCKGCLAYQQVRRVDCRCANCPSMRKRKPRAVVVLDKITAKLLKSIATRIVKR